MSLIQRTKVPTAPLMAHGREQVHELVAIFKSAQTLSSERSMECVIERLLANALQCVNAELAVLCVAEDATLTVVGRSSRCGESIETKLESTTVTPEFLPSSIVYLVKKTKETMFRENAGNDPIFGADPYIRKRNSKAVLCVPLVKQGDLIGVLYLESSHLPTTLASKKVTALEILASQGAVALENAKLYHTLQLQHDRREMVERKLRDTQDKLDRVAKTTQTGELVAFIVHEVSQPVSAVGTCSRAALRWLDRERPVVDEAFSMLEQISADSQRASEVVESIREMVRKSLMNITTIDIHEIIKNVLRLLDSKCSANNVIVDGNYQNGQMYVLGDRTLLQQVVINLTSNAIEAMVDAGVDTRRLEIVTRVDRGDILKISFTDSGPGIAEDAAKIIFNSFYTTKSAGLGLGLFICRSIAESHGGGIALRSTRGAGACFELALPQPNCANF
jgi:signal transduction histidine kinase